MSFGYILNFAWLDEIVSFDWDQEERFDAK